MWRNRYIVVLLHNYYCDFNKKLCYIILLCYIIIIIIIILAFPADIGRKPASPARGSRHVGAGNAYMSAGAGFAGNTSTPVNETADS